MDAVSSMSNLLLSIVDKQLESANKMTNLAVTAAVGNAKDASRADAMAMFGIGANFDSYA